MAAAQESNFEQSKTGKCAFNSISFARVYMIDEGNMSVQVDEDSWKCAVCCELLYKPVANACSHLFCFWCAHRAMSPFSNSSCPLCRTKYGHFPAPAWKLHKFLEATFPEAYATRAKENAEEEEEMDAASPEPPATLPEASSTPGHLAESDFLCDGCGKLLYQPAILNCGHVVCQPTCLPGINCPCPECSSPILRRPEVCKQLAQLLESAFPEASAKREQEVAEHLVRLQDSEPPAEPMSLGADNAKDLPPDDETLPAPPPIELPEGIPLNGPAATIMSWLQGRDYAHFGIGCDSCGMFPIVGRRYRCKQCPESIGFDLCGTCHDRGVGRVLGRFNQKHVPEHEMEEVAPRMTSLHLLQAANPELSFEQLMTLVQLARSRDDDEEDAGGDENGGSEPGVAGNGEGDIAEAGTGDQGTDSAHAPIDVGGAVPEHTSSVVDHENMRTMALGSEGLEGSTLEDAAQGDAQEAGEMGGSEGSEEVEGAVMPLRRGPRPAPDPSAQWPSPSAPGFASDGGRDA